MNKGLEKTTRIGWRKLILTANHLRIRIVCDWSAFRGAHQTFRKENRSLPVRIILNEVPQTFPHAVERGVKLPGGEKTRCGEV
ncbi:hypothetical protein SDC9_45656 [bioreactor metagenome]|uniref:Uncharacterized protein n=1 Tax=bioreactor metagenome TaxID=1076179 RepID=A0A644W787_9ZZZZ